MTTILDSSVKEITATEFSTETRVDTQLVTRTVANPVIQNTQLPQLSAALALVIIIRPSENNNDRYCLAAKPKS